VVDTSSLAKIAEGREAEIYAWEEHAVLRLLRNANAQAQIDWERTAMEAARTAGVSVPAVLGVTAVDGRPGLIMERVDGVDLLTTVGKQPWQVAKAATIAGKLHAAMHGVVAPGSIPAWKDVQRRRIERSDLVPEHIAAFAFDQIESLPNGDRLCHGDFHPGNIIANGEPVVIDWTNVTRGDPDADLSRTLLMHRMGSLPPGTPLTIRAGALFGRRIMRMFYLRAYRSARSVDMRAVERWAAPVAAVRLTENIAEERASLLKLLERWMADARVGQ
jgi:aminoglycoside phosphotransferase (APT) family kinase protein